MKRGPKVIAGVKWGGPQVICSRDVGSHVEILFRHDKYGERVSRVSHEHFDLIVSGGWRLSLQVGRGGKRDEPLLRVYTYDGQTRRLLTARLYECPPGFVRDHINGDSLDDRPQNIRLLTFSENAINNWKRRSGVRIYESKTSRTVSFRVPLDGYEEVKRRFVELGREKHGVYRAIKESIL